MHTHFNNIDFGIYADHKAAYIIGLNHDVHEELMEALEEHKAGHAAGSQDVNQQIHIQNKQNELIKKFCKNIIAKIERPHRIMVFGPAEVKHELHRELEQQAALKNIPIQIETTDYMTKDEAVRYVTAYYHNKK